MSISAIGSDTIDKRNLVGMGDYLNSLPSVSVLDQGPGFNSVVIRGISADPQAEGAESTAITGVYFGETPLSGLGLLGNSADIKLVDIERVEVMRGPQGTLYGAGAMGGVVRNIPVKPNLNTVEGKLSLDYSNTAEEGGDNSAVKAVINVPVIEDVLAIRAVAYRFDNSGYYKNIAASDPETSAAAITYSSIAVDESDRGNNEVTGGRVIALWKPVDNLTASLTYLKQDIEQDGWGQEDLVLQDSWHQRRFKIRTKGDKFTDEGFEDDLEIATLTIEYDLGWGTLTSSTSKADEESVQFKDANAFIGGFYPWGQTQTYENSVISEELRLASQLDGPLEFLVGLYYEDRDFDRESLALFGGVDTSLSELAPIIPAGITQLDLTQASRSVEQRALFGEISYALNDQTKVIVGGRAFEYEREADLTADGVFGSSDNRDLDSDENDVSLKASVEVTPNDDTLLYATWSEGFRLGYAVAPDSRPTCDQNGDGFYDGSSQVSTGQRTIESDFVENIEIGSKLSLMDNRMTLNTAIFQADWDGIPAFVFFDTCFASLNVGEARSRGAELEMAYSVSDALLLNFSTSYTDTELTKVSAQLALGGEEGDRLPGSPRYNASLGLEYRFTLSEYDSYIRSDYYYVGGFYNNLQEQGVEAGDYGKLNLKAGLSLGSVDVAAYIDNLTNADDITWVDREFSLFGLDKVNRLRPRTIGLTMNYRF